MEYGEMVEEFEEFIEDDGIDYSDKFYINLTELEIFNPSLYDNLIKSPDKAIDAFKEALETLPSVDKEKVEKEEIGFKNIEEKRQRRIRDVKASGFLDKLIFVDAALPKENWGDKFLELESAVFECVKCGDLYEKKQDSNDPKAPYKCECGSRKFKIREKNLVDKRELELEEKGVESPSTLDAYAYGRDALNYPGVKISAYGILRHEKKKGTGKIRYKLDIIDIEAVE